MEETINRRYNLLNDRLELINQQKLMVHQDIKQFIKDKSIPLDKRWELFIKSDIGGEESYIMRWKTLNTYKIDNNGSYRDTLGDYIYSNYERYRTVGVEGLIEDLQYQIEEAEEIIEERIREDGDQIDEEDLFDDTILQYRNANDVPFGEQGLEELMEDILTTCTKSFIFDW